LEGISFFDKKHQLHLASATMHCLRASPIVALNFNAVKTVCSVLDPLLAREAMFTSDRSSKFWGSKKMIVIGVHVRVIFLPRALSRAGYIASEIAFCRALCFRALVCSPVEAPI
jgi:hypothetical protein